MNFKELLEKYRNNNVTYEEKKMVQKEIEKIRLINEYIIETDDMDFDVEQNFEEDPADIKKLTTKVVKSRRKIITTSVAIAIFTIIIFQNLLVPFLNSFFYNPQGNSFELFRDDLTVKLDAFSRLHFPDHYATGTMVENTGIGRYSFTAILGNKFRQGNRLLFQDDFITGTINRNRLNFDYNFFTKFPPINIFYQHRATYNTPEMLEAIKKEQLETIQKVQDLPSHIYLSAYISFNRDLSMAEFSEIYNEFYHKNLFVNWVAVREVEGPGHRGPLIGFAPPGAEPRFQELETKYPYFNISIYVSKNEGNVESEIFEKHFKELLRFQLDNISFLNMIRNDIVHNGFRWYYQSILNYVKENGVYTYGIKVQGDPESILRLIEHEAFEHIVIDDIRVRLP